MVAVQPWDWTALCWITVLVGCLLFWPEIYFLWKFWVGKTLEDTQIPCPMHGPHTAWATMMCTCEAKRQERKRSRQLECYKERQVWSSEGGEEQPRVSSLWSHLRPWWNPSPYSFWGPCLSPWPYSIAGLCWWDDHCPCYHQRPGRCPRPEQLPGTTLISKGFTELALSSLAIAPGRAGPAPHLLPHSREQE